MGYTSSRIFEVIRTMVVILLGLGVEVLVRMVRRREAPLPQRSVFLSVTATPNFKAGSPA